MEGKTIWSFLCNFNMKTQSRLISDSIRSPASLCRTPPGGRSGCRGGYWRSARSGRGSVWRVAPASAAVGSAGRDGGPDRSRGPSTTSSGSPWFPKHHPTRGSSRSSLPPRRNRCAATCWKGRNFDCQSACDFEFVENYARRQTCMINMRPSRGISKIYLTAAITNIISSTIMLKGINRKSNYSFWECAYEFQSENSFYSRNSWNSMIFRNFQDFWNTLWRTWDFRTEDPWVYKEFHATSLAI